MVFQDPIVAGSQLVRDAIQSAEYEPGKTGWIIRRDGNAEFNSGTFRGDVDVYDAEGNLVGKIDATGIATGPNLQTEYGSYIKMIPAGGAAIVLQPTKDPNNMTRPGEIYVRAGIEPDYQPEMLLTSPVYFKGAGSPRSYISMKGAGNNTEISEVGIIADSIHVTAPIALLFDGDWRAVQLLNGWADRGGSYAVTHVRKVASPPNSLQIRANLWAGVTADGTAVMQLPADCLPAYSASWVAGANSGAGASFELSTDGVIRAWGQPAGQVAQFSVTVPLD